MDELEQMNQMERVNYYDKSHWEEDAPIEEKIIPIEIQKIFENLEQIFIELSEGVDDVNEALKKSIEERQMKNIDTNDFIYGEIVILF